MAKGKAGRKKLAGVKRTASGRKSRAAGANDENIEPILTRMRMFGLSEKDARDQKAASFIGRLQLTKVINHSQYDAAIAFFDIHDNYKRAISAPDGMKSSGGVGGGGGTDAHAAWCRGAILRYDRAVAAVQDEQNLLANRGATMIAALDYLVLRNEQVWHLVGDCRLALNALAHHPGIERKILSASMAA